VQQTLVTVEVKQADTFHTRNVCCNILLIVKFVESSRTPTSSRHVIKIIENCPASNSIINFITHVIVSIKSLSLAVAVEADIAVHAYGAREGDMCGEQRSQTLKEKSSEAWICNLETIVVAERILGSARLVLNGDIRAGVNVVL